MSQSLRFQSLPIFGRGRYSEASPATPCRTGYDPNVKCRRNHRDNRIWNSHLDILGDAVVGYENDLNTPCTYLFDIAFKADTGSRFRY